MNCIPKEAYWFSRGGNTQKIPSIKHFHMQYKAVHLNNDISSKRKKSLLEFYLKTNFLSLGKTYDAICWRMVGWPIAESADSLTISWWCDVLLNRHSLERYVTHVRTGWRIPIQWLSHPGKHLKPTLCYAPARCSLLLLQLFIAIYTARELIECPPHWDLKSFLDEKPWTDPNGILLSLAGSISAEAHILSCSALTS